MKTGTTSKTVNGTSQLWRGRLVLFVYRPEIGGDALCEPNEHDPYDFGDEYGHDIGVLNCRRCHNEAIDEGFVD